MTVRPTVDDVPFGKFPGATAVYGEIDNSLASFKLAGKEIFNKISDYSGEAY